MELTKFEIEELKEEILWCEKKLNRIERYTKEKRMPNMVAQKANFLNYKIACQKILDKNTYNCPEYQEFQKALKNL